MMRSAAWVTSSDHRVKATSHMTMIHSVASAHTCPSSIHPFSAALKAGSAAVGWWWTDAKICDVGCFTTVPPRVTLSRSVPQISRPNFLQPAELTYTNIMLLIVKSFVFQYALKVYWCGLVLHSSLSVVTGGVVNSLDSGGVVNSLDFCPASSLKSLGCFYFRCVLSSLNGRRWQWICKFYTANVKGIFWGTWS